MKIATAAEAFEVNIAPHNFYGHLATMMKRISPLRSPICASWRSTSTASAGTRKCSPLRPSSRAATWSSHYTEPNEDAIRAHPPKAPGGLLHYRQP
jgi:galactonate dehydratase